MRRRMGAAQIGLDHRAVLRVDGRRQDDLAALARCDIEREQHRLRQRGRAVVVAGVADLHAGEPADHALVLEQRLQQALAHLRLVLRVGGVELAAREHVVDGRRPEMVIGAGAEERQRGIGAKLRAASACISPCDLEFGGGRRKLQGREAHVRRNVGEQILHTGEPDRREHVASLALGVRHVAHRSILAPCRPKLASGEAGQCRCSCVSRHLHHAECDDSRR